jgi:toxin secretion/phage lysis holin|nr:MAG TPA: holin [Caudoviricetes sp.]
MNWKTKFDMLIAFFGGIISYLLGGWDIILTTLAIFMVLDYITGMIASFIEKTWNSEKGCVGLIKKGTIVLLVILAVFLDRLITGDKWVFRTVICMFYIANEGLSIVENCSRIGLPLPKRLLDALEQLRKDNDTDNTGN